MNKSPLCVQTCNGFSQLMFTPSIEHDECTFLQKAARCGSADPGAGACNDHYLVRESIHLEHPLVVSSTPTAASRD